MWTAARTAWDRQEDIYLLALNNKYYDTDKVGNLASFEENKMEDEFGLFKANILMRSTFIKNWIDGNFPLTISPRTCKMNTWRRKSSCRALELFVCQIFGLRSTIKNSMASTQKSNVYHIFWYIEERLLFSRPEEYHFGIEFFFFKIQPTTLLWIQHQFN